MSESEKQDRFYIWLDDFDSCRAGSYKIGDSLVRCDDECQGQCWDTDHEVEAFHLTRYRGKTYAEAEAYNENTKEQAEARLVELNEWWNGQTLESLGLEHQKAIEQLESARTQRNNADGYLADAVGLVVRLYHGKVTGQFDLDLDADLSRFWNYYTKKAIPEALWPTAYDDGLPLDSIQRKAVRDQRRISAEEQKRLEHLDLQDMLDAAKRGKAR